MSTSLGLCARAACLRCPATPALPPLPLVTAWWAQNELDERLSAFRASRQPTPRTRPLSDLHVAKSAASWQCAGCPRSGSADASSPQALEQPVLLISACLLSYPVTYRGTHTRLPATLRPLPLLFLTEVLVKELRLVRCVPVCPEMQLLGLPAPRAPLRLVRAATPSASDCGEERPGAADAPGCRVESYADPRRALLRLDPAHDTLDTLTLSEGSAALHLAELRRCVADVDGVVLKSSSLSCGVGDARLYDGGDGSSASARHQGAGRRPAAPSHDADHFSFVDGFFTHLLRNSLASRHSTRNAAAQPHPDSLDGGDGAAPPVLITSDRLLTKFRAGEQQERAAAAGAGLRRRKADEVGAAAPLELTSLDCFLERVLRHREWRRSQRSAVLPGRGGG